MRSKVKDNSYKVFFFLGVVLFSLCFFAQLFIENDLFITFKYINELQLFSLLGAILLVLISCGIFIKRYQFHYGLVHGFSCFILEHRLKEMFRNALLTEDKTELRTLPSIRVFLNKGMNTGKLYIENSITLDKRLDKTNLSSALGKYVIDDFSLSKDENFYEYNFIDVNLLGKEEFNSFYEFHEFSRNYSNYELFLNKRDSLPLQHSLIVGATGSGKSYALYGLIMQMRIKNIHYNLYFADPKMSGLYVIGQSINLPNEQNSFEFEDIIESLKEFNKKLNERQVLMSNNLTSKIDSDYRDYGEEPYIFIFDEFAAFMGVLETQPKSLRDEVNSYLTNIVLKGRQSGFFIIIAMQKSDASILKTALRDNLTFKVVLGNAEDTTYITTFGATSTIPKRNYNVGEGVMTEPSIAPNPRTCSFPYLNFDLNSNFKRLKELDEAWVM